MEYQIKLFSTKNYHEAIRIGGEVSDSKLDMKQNCEGALRINLLLNIYQLFTKMYYCETELLMKYEAQ